MLRVVFLFIIGVVFGVASEQVEIIANNAQKDDGIVKASDGVVLFYDGYMIEAKSLEYDTIKKVVKLNGNVVLYKDKLVQAHTDAAMLDLRSKDVTLKPLLLIEQTNSVWAQGESACKSGAIYTITNSYISSCNINDPDWKIGYGKAEFDSEDEWFTSYNNTFYIGDIPVFYLPIFGLPTSKKRRTGLLFPKFSYSNDYGLSYMQPIYFAPSHNYDIELTPQIKSGKGAGAYATLRFVDTPTSKGAIKSGFFNTQSSYFRDENLDNRNFYGFEVLYERDSLFDKYIQGYTDGLLVDGTWLNDIGYDRQQYNEIEKSDDYGTRDSQMVTSTINYYLSNEKHYFGVNSKLFIDTTKTSNADTFQMLPSVNYHIFKDSFLHENLLYSLDAKATNYTRKDGYSIKQYEIDVPVGFSWSFFDDYLGVSISENLYGTYLDYDDFSGVKNGSYINNFHKISLFTNLSKEYDDFFHNINLYANYIIPSFDDKRGHFSPFVSLDTPNEHLELKLEQFFYDNQDIEVSHFVSQKIHMDDYTYKYGDLENELRVDFGDFYAESIVSYSHEEAKISSAIHTIGYKDKKNDLALSHSFSDTLEYDKSNFLDLSYAREITPRDDLYTDIQYNLKDDFVKKMEIGWVYKSDCWSCKLSAKKERVPKLELGGSNALINKGIYLEVTLVPFGKSLRIKEESY
jgi:LPS-assembly protein